MKIDEAWVARNLTRASIYDFYNIPTEKSPKYKTRQIFWALQIPEHFYRCAMESLFKPGVISKKMVDVSGKKMITTLLNLDSPETLSRIQTILEITHHVIFLGEKPLLTYGDLSFDLIDQEKILNHMDYIFKSKGLHPRAEKNNIFKALIKTNFFNEMSQKEKEECFFDILYADNKDSRHEF